MIKTDNGSFCLSLLVPKSSSLRNAKAIITHPAGRVPIYTDVENSRLHDTMLLMSE